LHSVVGSLEGEKPILRSGGEDLALIANQEETQPALTIST
jgi:hypothetical protein